MNRRHAFSLVEVLTVIALVALLASVLLALTREMRYEAAKTESANNLRQLVLANHLHASDHGHYSPWSNANDSIHWHGKRQDGKFTGTGGYLSPYLDDGKVRLCPIFASFTDSREGNAFDEGTGGYGYNATYIGGTPLLMDSSPPPGSTRNDIRPWWTMGNQPAYLMDPGEVVMFTSTAIVRGGGIVETGNSVPHRHLSPGGHLGEVATPTVHFRFRGHALVAWADARITFEKPNEVSTSHNVYHDDNSPFQVGWFGPAEWNGYWNPRFRDGLAY